MNEVFVIRNQHGHYWGKAKLWVDGSDPRAVLRLKHRDEAVNSLVELSSRDVNLRGQVVAAELDTRGQPEIEPSQIPLPIKAECDQDADIEEVRRAVSGSDPGATAPAGSSA